jgi:hypothetical protein
VSADGALFTGIVIVDRNRPVVVLAARQAASPRPNPPSPPATTASRYARPQHGSTSTALQHRLFDEDEEEAMRGETPPFWRR